MIEFHSETLGDIPVIHAVPAGGREKVLPTMVVMHSFGVSAELVGYFGLLAARRGMRVLLPSAPEHGGRSGHPETRAERFWPIVTQYVDEVAQVHAAFAPCIMGGSIALAGTSMGAFGALSAAARYDFVACAAAYMGTAFWRDASRTIFPPLGRWDADCADAHDAAMAPFLGHAPDMAQLRDTPLYVWHGARDDVVPHADALRLAAALEPRVTLRIDPAGGHRVTDAAATEGVDFLVRHLAPKRESS